MNSIYKTIRDPMTGRTVAASEHARRKGSSSGTDGVISLVAPFGAAVFLLLHSGGLYAQSLTYDGSASMLDTFSRLMYRSGGSTVLSGANLIVDYTSGSVPSNAIGGYSEAGGAVTGNSVTHVQGKIGDYIIGGQSYQTVFTASNNQSGNTSTSYYSPTTTEISPSPGSLLAKANNNTVNAVSSNASDSTFAEIQGGEARISLFSGAATGGINGLAPAITKISTSAATVEANANQVISEHGGAATLYGGRAAIGATSANAQAGNSNTSVNHAYTDAHSDVWTTDSNASANDNSVTLKGGAPVGEILTGYVRVQSTAGNATAGTGNTSVVDAGAYASATASTDLSELTASADRNKLTIGGNANGLDHTYGGFVNVEASAGVATAGTATAASPLSAFAYAEANVWAAGAHISADHNVISVESGANVSGKLTGGYAGLMAIGGQANGGTVTGTGKANFTSAMARVDLSFTKVSASGNTVVMNGQLNNGAIYGGDTTFYAARGTTTLSASGVANGSLANDTAVIVSISQVLATNNTVTLGDQATITGTDTMLYGGRLSYNTVEGHKPEFYDVFSGNTLNFSAQPVSVHTVANFEKYNFTLEPSLANTNTALISAQNIVLGSNSDNLDAAQTAKASEIKVVGIHSGNTLSAGDRFVLMRANSLTGNGNGTTSYGIAQQGISLLYDVRTNVDLAGKEVTAEILACQNSSGVGCTTEIVTPPVTPVTPTNPSAPAARTNPQLKSLSEGYLAGTMLVTRGADLVADNSFDAISAQNNGQGLAPFALASASHNRYDSGSHITSNDTFLSAGLSYRQEQWVTGLFVEGGRGNYDSHNSFYNAASVHGDGDARYHGAGLLGRYTFTNGFYADASYRFGKNRTHFDTNDLQNLASGEYARYSVWTRYNSAHIGMGYELPLNEIQTLDLSAKYLETRMGGKHTIVAGDPIHFKPVDSKRLRLNGELVHRYDPSVTLKVGLGYEHEYDGKAKATTYDQYRIDAPDVKGGTGILSLGAQVKPSTSRNLTLDFAAIGYTGKRDGYGASALMQYRF